MNQLINNEPILADIDKLAKYDKEVCRTYMEAFGTLEKSKKCAFIPVIGGLAAASYFWGNSSYTDIEREIEAMLASDDIEQIILYIDSPGGEVAGCFSLCDYIKEAKTKKPITAFITRLGASAAYLIASCCNTIIVEPDAEVGSCGCMLRVNEYDNEFLKKEYGILERVFRSECSPRKNKSKILDENEAKAAQERVDEIGIQYLQYVADSRGMTLEDAKKKCGQGALLTAEEALSVGMIDKIQTYSAFVDELNSSLKEEGEGANMDITKMSTEEKDKLFAELISDNPALLAPSQEKVMKEERERIAKLSALKKGDSKYDAIIDKAISEGMSLDSTKLALFDYVQTNPQANSSVTTPTATQVLNAFAASTQEVTPAQATEEDEFNKFFGPISKENE